MHIFKAAFDFLLCNLLLDESNSNKHTLHLHSPFCLRISVTYQHRLFISFILEVLLSMSYVENQWEAWAMHRNCTNVIAHEMYL